MSRTFLLGVDFGGGASKATLLSGDGMVAAVSTEEYPTYCPRDGWTEQNPEEVYEAFLLNTAKIIRESRVNPADIKALCLDAATHTAVLLDAEDRVVRNSIYWTDKRSSEEAAFLVSHHSALIEEQSFNTPSPIWTLPQLLWLKKNESGLFSRISKILFMKDYVRRRLTGDFLTDSIDAMGSMLMDARKNRWSAELLGLAGIDASSLPEIVDPGTAAGRITERAAEETGLSSSTMVVTGATDTVMEVFAAGAIRPGQATIKLATAGRICPVTDRAHPNPALVNYRHIIPGLWYPGTGTKSCAASYRWYRDVFGLHESELARSSGSDPYLLLDEAAASVPAGASNLFFHPYLQGELSPYLDNDLRGSFTGISSFHTKAHFSRAVLEGVAYSLLDCFLTIRDMGIVIDRAAVLGGGAKSPLWRQILCDVLGIELVRMKNVDSSLGSAMFAGVAAGVFESFEDSVRTCVRVDGTVRPGRENREIYQRGFETYKKIHDALAPVYGELAKRAAEGGRR